MYLAPGTRSSTLKLIVNVGELWPLTAATLVTVAAESDTFFEPPVLPAVVIETDPDPDSVEDDVGPGVE